MSALLFFTVASANGAASAAGVAKPVRVAVIVPLSVSGGASGILTADELETATSPGGYLQRVLTAVSGTSATVAIDPMIIASIRLLGADAPASALSWLASLASLSNDTFALSYADSDITLALQAGSTGVLAPTSFDFAIDASRFAPAPIDGSSTAKPDDNTDSNAPVPLPSTASLTQWDYTIPGIAWPIAGSATKDDLESITASGFSRTLLSSGNVRRGSGAVAAVARDSGELLVSDDDGSAQLGHALAAQTEPVWAASLRRLSTRIASIASAGDTSPTMVISTDRGVLPNVSRLQASLGVIEDLPGARVVGLSVVAAGPQTSAQIIDIPNVATRIGLVIPMLQAEATDRAFAQVTENPELITGERRIALLAALAPQWDRTETGWSFEIAHFIAQSVTLRDSVRVIESSDIIFAADRGLLPITVRNDLSQPVTVVITVQPRTPLLSIEGTQFELAIEPDSQRRALIPAQSRSNGIVELVVSIRTLGGLSIGPTTTVTTRVQAGWETPLTLIIGALVVLMFGFGLFRTIRRRRADRSVVPE